MTRKIMIAGGGTGGHVFAGIAIAHEWQKRFSAADSVLFVGAQGRIEEKLVPREGFRLELLKLGSLNRVALRQRISTLFQLPIALFSSAQLILKYQPDVVLGVGGYSSGPVVLMAKILRAFGLVRLEVALLEQNSVPGFTNRILGRWVDLIFCAFPGTESQFPGKRIVVTGNPVRNTMVRMGSAPRRPFTVFIFGGSQGALGMNTVVLQALPFLKTRQSEIRWIHQTGYVDYARVLEEHQKAGSQATVEQFIDYMPAAYAEASLLICRAGSSTLAEIAAVGRASVLIPLPTAADHHQLKNAVVFSSRGAAFLVEQGPQAGEALAQIIIQGMDQPDVIAELESAVVQFYCPQAAIQIVETFIHVKD